MLWNGGMAHGTKTKKRGFASLAGCDLTTHTFPSGEDTSTYRRGHVAGTSNKQDYFNHTNVPVINEIEILCTLYKGL
jgi:hypothetical protein